MTSLVFRPASCLATLPTRLTWWGYRFSHQWSNYGTDSTGLHGTSSALNDLTYINIYIHTHILIYVCVFVSWLIDWLILTVRYVLWVKWSNLGKGVAPSPTPRCGSYWKGSLLVALDYGRQFYFIRHRHGYPWTSFATSPYRSSPLAGLQGYIPYPHIAAGCMFELVVLLLPGHMWGSIGVHHLWARPRFSSSVLHVWFV